MAYKSDIKEYQPLRTEGPAIIIGRLPQNDVLVKPISANETGSYLHLFESGGRLCAVPQYYENGEEKRRDVSYEAEIYSSGITLGLSGIVNTIPFGFKPNICSVLPLNVNLKFVTI